MVPAELVHKHNLKEGTIITPAQWEQLESEIARLNCRAEVNRMLAAREHSVGEVKLKLARKGFERGVIDATLALFHRNGLLDDQRLALAMARQLFERKPAGRSWLVAALRRKHIPREIAEEAVDVLLMGTDETEAAKAALSTKWTQIGQLDIESARKKAYTYLSRRGISYQAARAAFDALYNRSDEVEDHQDS